MTMTSLDIETTDGGANAKQRKKQRRTQIRIAMAAIAILLALFITFAVLYAKKDTSEDVCETAACKSAATQMSSYMDATADPCQDFNQFACGKFYKEATIESYDVRNGPFDSATAKDINLFKELLESPIMTNHSFERKMKTLYKECMDIDAIERFGLKVYPDDLRQDWPTLNTNWSSNSFNFQSLNDNFAAALQSALIGWGLYLEGNRTEDVYTFGAYSASFALSRDQLLDSRNSSKIRAFEKYYTDFAVALGANNETAEQDAKGVIDFQREIAKIVMSSADLNDSTLTTNPTTVEEMNRLFPYLNWVELFQNFLSRANITVEPTQKVNIGDLDYFKNLGDVVRNADKRAIQNTYEFQRANGLASMATKEMRAIMFEFDKVMSGVKEAYPRTMACIGTIDGAYNEGLAKLVANIRFTKKAEKFMDTLIKNLKKAFRANIEQADWMTNKTKEKAVEKLEKMRDMIGVPRENFTEDDLDTLYENYVVKGESFILDALQNQDQLASRDLQRLNQHVDKTRWSGSITEVNARNDADQNVIRFPLGILQPPFYSQDRPSYLNYGAIGAIIGHEIGHSFDTEGRGHDPQGRLDNWWTPADSAGYDKRAQCFIDQFSAFKFDFGKNLGKFPVDGKLTVTENVADTIGVKAAYRAYEMYVAERQGERELPLPGINLTDKQLFFLAFAQDYCEVLRPQTQKEDLMNDVHAAGRHRIIGTFQNSEEFAKAYKCKAGDYMDPVKKCTLW